MHLEQRAYQHLRELHIEPPTQGHIERLVTSALHRYEQSYFANTAARLPNSVKVKLRQPLDEPSAGKLLVSRWTMTFAVAVRCFRESPNGNGGRPARDTAIVAYGKCAGAYLVSGLPLILNALARPKWLLPHLCR